MERRIALLLVHLQQCSLNKRYQYFYPWKHFTVTPNCKLLWLSPPVAPTGIMIGFNKKWYNNDKLETLRVVTNDKAPVVLETGVVKDPARIQNCEVWRARVIVRQKQQNVSHPDTEHQCYMSHDVTNSTDFVSQKLVEKSCLIISNIHSLITIQRHKFIKLGQDCKCWDCFDGYLSLDYGSHFLVWILVYSHWQAAGPSLARTQAQSVTNKDSFMMVRWGEDAWPRTSQQTAAHQMHIININLWLVHD